MIVLSWMTTPRLGSAVQPNGSGNSTPELPFDAMAAPIQMAVPLYPLS